MILHMAILQPIAQLLDLLVFIHPPNFFWTVWLTLSTPPFDSEWRGDPLTIIQHQAMPNMVVCVIVEFTTIVGLEDT